MIEFNGEKFNALSDAAKFFCVSSKTVRDYIIKRIQSIPPYRMKELNVIDV